MVLVDVAVPMPVVKDEAMGSFNAGGGVVDDGGETEKEALSFLWWVLLGLEEVAELE